MTAHVLCGGCGRVLSDGPLPNAHGAVMASCDACDPTRQSRTCGRCGFIMTEPNPHFHVPARCTECDPTRKHLREEHFLLWAPGEPTGRCVFCDQRLTHAYEVIVR